MRQRWITVALAVTTVVALDAQTPRPTFEVASIKPVPPGPNPGITFTPGIVRGGSLWTVKKASLLTILRTAAYADYNMPGRIVGGPDWIRTRTFDITAKVDGIATRDQMVEMIRSLLEDRFRLVVHAEPRELEVYRLVLAKSDGRFGAGLRASSLMCSSDNPGPADSSSCGFKPRPQGELTRWTFGGTSIRGFANMLQPLLQAPVLDDTGLGGAFDIDLAFGTAAGVKAAPVNAGPEPVGPSIFSAVQEQLGLKLVPGQGSVEVLVIDSVQPPTEN